ncbi:MAG: hypothetical protein GEU78_13885 [Actinobacteria bacterium]|nr:hypothetical protein [Actinomycetota bacterium]
MARSRLTSLTEAANLIPDGAMVGVGGLMLYNKPMALIRELVQLQIRDLTVLCAAPSTIDVDQLIGAGCASTVILQSLTAERVGPVAPRFRALAQEGRIKVVDCDQGMINAGMRAGRFGLPSLPTVAGLGGDYADVAPDWVKRIEDPFTGRPLHAIRAMRPDYAIVHAAVADELGHAQQLASPVSDELLCAAADRIIVTAEQIVPRQAIQQSRAQTFTWAYKVAAVVEAPYGAHPLGVHGRYHWDGRHVKDYVELARTEGGFDKYVAKYISGPDTFPAYLDHVGWDRLLGLRSRAGLFEE